MISSDHQLDGSVTSASFEGTTTRGLWAALVETLSHCSAAGSGLVGSTRPDQPISAVGMFEYDLDLDRDPAAVEPSSRQVVA